MTYRCIGLWITLTLAAAGAAALTPPLLAAAGAADAAHKHISPPA